MTPSSAITISDWLSSSTDKLTKLGIKSARLDVLLLLEDVLKKDRTYLIAHPEEVLSSPQLTKLNTNLARRQKHEPIAYIRGRVDFYGRRFKVNDSVLIPRPESESFIDLIKKLKIAPKHIVDVGSGSGVLGITIKLELPESDVDLIESSKTALTVSKLNAKDHSAEVNFIFSDLLQKSSKTYDLVMANLPYVPNAYNFDAATQYEPSEALLGGPDGLDIYRELWSQIKSLKTGPKYVLIESLKFQHQDVEDMANRSRYVLENTDNLVQLFIN